MHELIGLADTGCSERGWVARYAEGLASYRARNFAAAAAAFEAVLQQRRGDRPALLMLERCAQLARTDPGDGWQAMTALNAK